MTYTEQFNAACRSVGSLAGMYESARTRIAELERELADEKADFAQAASKLDTALAENAKLRDKLNTACGCLRMSGRDELANRLSP